MRSSHPTNDTRLGDKQHANITGFNIAVETILDVAED